jgi:hypothetical protein
MMRYSLIMTVLTKSAPIESLGLGPGVHLLKVVVAGDTLAFEVAASADRATPEPRQGTGFVKTWSGTARKMDVPGDDWLAHINTKHLR